MASHDDKTPDLNDKARAAIKRHLFAHSISMAKGSLMLGKNPSYLHQFLKGGTPKRLPYEMAELIHSRLGISLEALLIDPAPPSLPTRPLLLEGTPSARTPACPSDVYAPGVSGAPAFVAAYADRGSTARGAEQNYVEAPRLSRSDEVFGVWISEPTGRLRAGDLAYVSRITPARPGDMVLVLLGEEIAGLGELAGITGAALQVTTEDATHDLPRPTHTALKVIGARFG